MATLTAPSVDVRPSFLAAMREFAGEGMGSPGDPSMVGEEINAHGHAWHTEEGFSAYLSRLRAARDERTPWREGFVGCTSWWWVEGSEYLGRIAVRHRLTAFLREEGGHIGYDVRPSARRQGHATAALRAALPRISALGIESALVTCDTGNVASRKVIEACGGVLEDQRRGKFRYWITTS